MDYHKHYSLLIDRARVRLLESYTERHHIVPRCIGGSDDKDNLVDLTPEEHYLAHQLLVKMYPGHRGIAYAAILMGANGPNKRNNKTYGWLKRRYSESCQGRTPWNKGKTWEEIYGDEKATEMKEQASLIRKGKALGPLSAETRSNMSAAAKGRPKTAAHKAKIGLAHFGMKRSAEACQNISTSLLGKKDSVETRNRKRKAHLGKPKPWLRGRQALNAKQIIINGVLYNSRTEAARILRKDRTTIYNWIRSGKAKEILCHKA